MSAVTTCTITPDPAIGKVTNPYGMRKELTANHGAIEAAMFMTGLPFGCKIGLGEADRQKRRSSTAAPAVSRCAVIIPVSER